MNEETLGIQSRWGDALRNGFVVIPVMLVKRQSKLGIDNAEMVVLLNLLAQWHENDKPVWASFSGFAENMGSSVRTVQRVISSLEEKNLIRIEKLPEGKVVHLDTLAKRLQKKA